MYHVTHIASLFFIFSLLSSEKVLMPYKTSGNPYLNVLLTYFREQSKPS